MYIYDIYPSSPLWETIFIEENLIAHLRKSGKHTTDTTIKNSPDFVNWRKTSSLLLEIRRPHSNRVKPISYKTKLTFFTSPWEYMNDYQSNHIDRYIHRESLQNWQISYLVSLNQFENICITVDTPRWHSLISRYMTQSLEVFNYWTQSTLI